jgi:hypothetical protein
VEDQVVFEGDGVLGEGAPPDTEHRIADGESRYRGADGHDCAAEVSSGHGVLRSAEPEGEAAEAGQARHEVPGPAVQARGLDLHEYFLVGDLRNCDLPDAPHVAGAIGVLQDRLHCSH